MGPVLSVRLRVKQREETKGGTNSRCPFYRGVRQERLDFIWTADEDNYKCRCDHCTFFNQDLSGGIQFRRASLNGALTLHKNKDIKTLK